LFATLTHEELSRLVKLTQELGSLEDVLEALGPPDDDLNPGDGVGLPEGPGTAPTFEYCRTLVYNSLSEFATVHASERSDGSVRFSFSGKLLARPDGGGTPPTDDPDTAV
jgi:hypothetical protein